LALILTYSANYTFFQHNTPIVYERSLYRLFHPETTDTTDTSDTSDTTDIGSDGGEEGWWG